jgi:hypothetical protein
MSHVGQSGPNWAFCAMSGLPPVATEERTLLVVRFVPISDIARTCNKRLPRLAPLMISLSL